MPTASPFLPMLQSPTATKASRPDLAAATYSAAVKRCTSLRMARRRFWVHKTLNILSHFPKNPGAAGIKDKIHQIWGRQRKRTLTRPLICWCKPTRLNTPQAVEYLSKDHETLLAFYDFPTEHWVHIRTPNPIESMFLIPARRDCATKRRGIPMVIGTSRQASVAMAFKLSQSAQRGFQRPNGAELMADVLAGVTIEDGVKKLAA